MKTHFLNLKVALSVSLIVLSIAMPVNYRLAGMAGAGGSQIADGVPLPPPPPPKSTNVLVADGVPLPPPPPPEANFVAVWFADGVPMPSQPQPLPWALERNPIGDKRWPIPSLENSKVFTDFA